MARRKVSVQLELEVAAYLRGSAEAATVTRRVRSEVHELGDEADDTGRDMAQLAANTDLAAHQVDDLGDEARGTAAELMVLERQLHSTGRAARAMSLDMMGPGGRSPMSSTLTEMPGFLGSFGAPRLRSALIGILVGAALAAAPTVGAMLAGVVSGAVGTGGVAGGLLMASRDPRVRHAARAFGEDIADEFFRGGDAFVEPALQSMEILEQAFRDMQVPEAFGLMADDVTIIARGFGDLGRNLMPGVNAAFSRMTPFAVTAAEGFSDMGDALSTFLDDITASPGAVAGLETTFHLINGLIMMLGKGLRFLSDAYMTWVRIQRDAFSFAAGLAAVTGDAEQAATFAHLADQLNEMLNAADRVPETTEDAARGVESFGAAGDLAAQATGRLATALSDAHSAFLDWAGAEIAAEDALDRMREALDESNGSMDVHEEKGREARAAVLRFAEAARVAAQRKFDETQSVEEANKVYEGYRRDLIKTLVQSGLTRAEARKLADQWLALAKMPNITKTITINHDDVYREHRQGERSSSGRAAGGSVLAGRLYQYDEQQPEGFFFRPPTDGYIAPLAGGMPMIAMGGGGAGGGVGTVNVRVQMVDPDGQVLREQLIDNALGRGISETTIQVAYP